MRKFFLLGAVATFLTLAADALACSACGVHPDGCDFCYESIYDGAVDCFLLNGEHCALVDDGGCAGVPRWCPGGHCPDDQEARRAEPQKEWRLASVQVIRPKETLQTRARS